VGCGHLLPELWDLKLDARGQIEIPAWRRRPARVRDDDPGLPSDWDVQVRNGRAA